MFTLTCEVHTDVRVGLEREKKKKKDSKEKGGEEGGIENKERRQGEKEGEKEREKEGEKERVLGRGGRKENRRGKEGQVGQFIPCGPRA